MMTYLRLSVLFLGAALRYLLSRRFRENVGVENLYLRDEILRRLAQTPERVMRVQTGVSLADVTTGNETVDILRSAANALLNAQTYPDDPEATKRSLRFVACLAMNMLREVCNGEK